MFRLVPEFLLKFHDNVDMGRAVIMMLLGALAPSQGNITSRPAGSTAVNAPCTRAITAILSDLVIPSDSSMLTMYRRK